jgi:hypothetical protein
MTVAEEWDGLRKGYAGNGQFVPANDAALSAVAQYRRAATDEKAAKEAKEAHRNTLLKLLGSNSGFELPPDSTGKPKRISLSLVKETTYTATRAAYVKLNLPRHLEVD